MSSVRASRAEKPPHHYSPAHPARGPSRYRLPLSCLYPGQPDRPGGKDAPEEERVDRARRRQLLCARCLLPVTDDEARFEALGRHEHVCANPHGFAYHIGCFTTAPGCVGIGPEESYWSWFPGYSWQLALCRGCHGHLGWRFRAAASIFYGLILDRLLPADRGA